MNKNLIIVILAAVIVVLLNIKTKKVVERLPSSLPAHTIDTLAKQVGVKPSKVINVVQTNITAHKSVQIKKDTVIVYKDRWNEITVKETATDTIEVSATMKDSLNIVTYNKRNWFLGKERTYVQIINSNPDIKYSGLKHYEVPVKQKQWSVGVGISYGWNGQRWQPQVGVSLTRTLMRF